MSNDEVTEPGALADGAPEARKTVRFDGAIELRQVIEAVVDQCIALHPGLNERAEARADKRHADWEVDVQRRHEEWMDSLRKSVANGERTAEALERIAHALEGRR